MKENNTAESQPRLNIFARAAALIRGNHSTSSATAEANQPGPAARITALAAEMASPSPKSIALAEHKARVRAPIQAPAEASFTAPKFTGETHDLILIATGRTQAKTGDRAVAVATLNAAGIQLNESGNKAVIPRDVFDNMPHGLRGDVMRGGISIISERRPKNATPAEHSEACELTFPEAPRGPRRTWRQFFNMGDAQTAEINEKAAKEEGGIVLRGELWDAYSSMFPTSWRYDEDPPEPVVPDRSQPSPQFHDKRSQFLYKFKPGLAACTTYGPWDETPNDPPPAERADAMKALDFLNLPESIVGGFQNKMVRTQFEGRNMRAELKRAYRAGTPAMKQALYLRFAPALLAFPKEFI